MHIIRAQSFPTIQQTDLAPVIGKEKQSFAPVFLYCAAGLGLAGWFQAGETLPLKASVPALFVVAAIGMIQIRIGIFSLLTRLMIFLYCLPFIGTTGYLFNEEHVWYEMPHVLAMMQDRFLQQQMVLIGLVGLIGLQCGMLLIAIRTKRQPDEPGRDAVSSGPFVTLSPLIFYLSLIVAHIMSWLSAPSQTLLQAGYASVGTESLAADFNFNGGYTISYVLLVTLFIDAQMETRNSRRKKQKLTAVILSSIFIIVFWGLMRGDRESIGLVAALVALYLCEQRGVLAHLSRQARQVYRKRVLKIAIPLGLVVFAFAATGAVRSLLFNEEERKQVNLVTAAITELSSGTWTAILLTNLAMTSQYLAGDFEYLYGQTFVDYALSLPPGFVAKALDFKRPLENDSGPAWWFGHYSLGGIHVALVPFKNFGIFGLFLIMALYGVFIARIEALVGQGKWQHRLFYGAMFTVSFFWFWYGDMYLIRTIMMAVCAIIIYRFSTGVR